MRQYTEIMIIMTIEIRHLTIRLLSTFQLSVLFNPRSEIQCFIYIYITFGYAIQSLCGVVDSFLLN